MFNIIFLCPSLLLPSFLSLPYSQYFGRWMVGYWRQDCCALAGVAGTTWPTMTWLQGRFYVTRGIVMMSTTVMTEVYLKKQLPPVFRLFKKEHEVSALSHNGTPSLNPALLSSAAAAHFHPQCSCCCCFCCCCEYLITLSIIHLHVIS